MWGFHWASCPVTMDAGRARLIRSHSSARISFETGNTNFLGGKNQNSDSRFFKKSSLYLLMQDRLITARVVLLTLSLNRA